MATIIYTDTTWAADSKHVLNGTVQIAPGATLTILAGAEIEGKGNSIEVGGNLVVAGTADDRVTLENVHLNFLGFAAPHMTITYTDFLGSALLPAGGSYGAGGLEVQNSLFTDAGYYYTYLWYPTSETVIENNLFVGYTFSVGTDDAPVLFKDNTFVVDDDEVAIDVWANGGLGSTISIHGNNFLGTGQAIVYVDGNHQGSVLDATGNWFGTNSEAEIRSRIGDSSDNLTLGPVAFTPFLNGPNALAPAVGTSGDDVLAGSAAADRLFGFGGKDAISGDLGDDILWGGRGRDHLTGGPGSDEFVIEVVSKKQKADKIEDFASPDLIALDQLAFERLKVGELRDSHFCRGTQSKDNNDFVIYHRREGTLYYDSDGDKGKHDPIKFAILDDRPKLSAADFEVFLFGVD